MGTEEATRQSLLARIHDPLDQAAWSEFVEAYTPFVYAFMRRRGLQTADAADVTQEVIRAVFCSRDGFHHNQRAGAFRSWLITIARRRLSEFFSRQERQATGSGDTSMLHRLSEVPDTDQEDAQLTREYQRCLFQWASDRVRPEFREPTWQAFWRTFVEGQPCESVAADLAMSREAVYMARCRILARLREKIREAEQ